MPDLSVLHYETLTGIVQEFTYPDREGLSLSEKGELFPRVDVDGDTAYWDATVEESTISELQAAGSASQPLKRATMSKELQKMFYFNRSHFLSGDEATKLRAIGTDDLDNMGAKTLAQDLKRLLMHEAMTQEYMLWKALSGSITIDVAGVAKDIGNALPSGHTPSVGDGSGTVSGDWNTAATDIVGDIKRMESLIIEDSGRTPARCYYGENIFGYIVKNTAISGTFGTTLSDRIMREQRIGYWMGMEWIPIRGHYTDSSDVKQPFVGDDVLIMTPGGQSDRWCSLQTGTVAVKDDNGNAVSMPSPASYSVVTDDPVGTKVIVKSVRLPVLEAPAAVVYATVS